MLSNNDLLPVLPENPAQRVGDLPDRCPVLNSLQDLRHEVTAVTRSVFNLLQRQPMRLDGAGRPQSPYPLYLPAFELFVHPLYWHLDISFTRKRINPNHDGPARIHRALVLIRCVLNLTLNVTALNRSQHTVGPIRIKIANCLHVLSSAPLDLRG